MSRSTEFVKNAIDELQYYVYIYSDPETKIPFYIGKGKGNRCFNHLFQTGESEKIKKLQELKAEGKEPVIEILVYYGFGADTDVVKASVEAYIDCINKFKVS